MNKLLTFVAIAEAATGLALLVVPSVVGRLLLGAELSGIAAVVGRMTAIALIALGVACWPGCTALCGMLTYSTLVTLYLAFVAVRGEFVGPLLRPAVLVHTVLTVVLTLTWFQNHRTAGDNQKERTEDL